MEMRGSLEDYKTGGSSTLAQDFVSWLHYHTTSHNKRYYTPDIDEYIASQYIRELYPDLSLDDTIQLMDNTRFMGKLASGTVPKHVQYHLLATRSSLQLKTICDAIIQNFIQVRNKLCRKYPRVLNRLGPRSYRHRSRVNFAECWDTPTSDNLVYNGSGIYTFPNFSAKITNPEETDCSEELDIIHRPSSLPSYSQALTNNSVHLRPNEPSGPSRKASPINSLLLLNQRLTHNQDDSRSSSKEFSIPLTDSEGSYYTAGIGNEVMAQSPDEQLVSLFQQLKFVYPSTLYVNQPINV